MLSLVEENYLKAIYHLSGNGTNTVSTNSLAEEMQTTPASVSDMIKRLAHKEVIEYKKYQGVNISEDGRKRALQVIRKHRLWEVFLVDKLNFNWDEVHDIAEQLEHIKSPLLIKRLDEFLGHPTRDPHGDPIPDEDGNFVQKQPIPLNQLIAGQTGMMVAVNDSSSSFLKYLDKVEVSIGSKIEVKEVIDFDSSMEIKVNHKSLTISETVAQNILVSQ